MQMNWWRPKDIAYKEENIYSRPEVQRAGHESGTRELAPG
jgi:hypothetical protein